MVIDELETISTIATCCYITSHSVYQPMQFYWPIYRKVGWLLHNLCVVEKSGVKSVGVSTLTRSTVGRWLQTTTTFTGWWCWWWWWCGGSSYEEWSSYIARQNPALLKEIYIWDNLIKKTTFKSLPKRSPRCSYSNCGNLTFMQTTNSTLEEPDRESKLHR